MSSRDQRLVTLGRVGASDASDPRVFPWLDVEVEAIVGQPLVSCESIGGGLTNTLHRVVTANGDIYGVKTFASDGLATESAVLARFAALDVPVPAVVRIHDRSLVYRWIDGVTLLDARRRGDDLAALAEPIGKALATIASTRIDLPRREVGPTCELLATDRVRERLGSELAEAAARRFHELEPPAGDALVHGDLGARNLIVAGGRLVGVIDWEAACTGSPMWDVGHVFRYPNRWSDAFRAGFARGYRDAGGELPEPWWLPARWLDATRLVGVLAEPRELPTVFADCRELIGGLVDATPR